jgi:uncharacterized protein YegJ (DUF2314 family)
MNQKISFFGVLIGILFACSTSDNEYQNNFRNNSLYNTDSEDIVMNEAIQTAKKTFPEFKKAFLANNESYDSFSVKIAFEHSEGHEHIWISDIFMQNNLFYGVVGNDPYFIPDLYFGDTVQIKEQLLSDWKYLENNALRGGYTIKVLRNRMSKQEQKSFDEAIDFKIID